MKKTRLIIDVSNLKLIQINELEDYISGITPNFYLKDNNKYIPSTSDRLAIYLNFYLVFFSIMLFGYLMRRMNYNDNLQWIILILSLFSIVYGILMIIINSKIIGYKKGVYETK